MPVTESDPTIDRGPLPAAPYNSLLKRFAIRLCVATTLGVLLLAGVEFFSFLRYRPSAKNAMEPAVNLELAEDQSAAEHKYWEEFEQANKVTYHQYVLWRRQPYAGETISIDANGVRRTLHTQCDDKTFTVWMFGDSVMWGAGAPDGETIPSLVAADYEKAGRAVCIVNYGEKGWSSTQELVGLIEELKHARRPPDRVLFYDGGTEAFTAYQSGRADVHSNYHSFKNFLDNWTATQKAGFSYLHETNTYRFLEKIAVKAPFHGKSAEPVESKPKPDAMAADVVRNYTQNMDIVETLAKQYGFRAVFVWYPNMAVGHKELTPYEKRVLEMEYEKFPGLGAMYQAAYQKARETNRPNLYYLGDLLDGEKASLYVGISHLKPEGNKIAADHLFEILEREASTAAAPQHTRRDH